MTEQNQRVVALTADYQATFSTPHGKRVLLDLMKKGGMMSTSYVPKDSHGTSFNEGQRSLVLHVCKLLRLDVAKLNKIIEEEDNEV